MNDPNRIQRFDTYPVGTSRPTKPRVGVTAVLTCADPPDTGVVERCLHPDCYVSSARPAGEQRQCPHDPPPSGDDFAATARIVWPWLGEVAHFDDRLALQAWLLGKHSGDDDDELKRITLCWLGDGDRDTALGGLGTWPGHEVEQASTGLPWAIRQPTRGTFRFRTHRVMSKRAGGAKLAKPGPWLEFRGLANLHPEGLYTGALDAEHLGDWLHNLYGVLWGTGLCNSMAQWGLAGIAKRMFSELCDWERGYVEVPPSWLQTKDLAANPERNLPERIVRDEVRAAHRAITAIQPAQTMLANYSDGVVYEGAWHADLVRAYRGTMATEPMPGPLVRWQWGCDVSEFSRRVNGGALVMASVRDGNGEQRSVATPMAKRLIELGSLSAVDFVAYYAPSDAFAQWARLIDKLEIDAPPEQKLAVKMLANLLPGKLAEMPYDLHAISDPPDAEAIAELFEPGETIPVGARILRNDRSKMIYLGRATWDMEDPDVPTLADPKLAAAARGWWGTDRGALVGECNPAPLAHLIDAVALRVAEVLREMDPDDVLNVTVDGIFCTSRPPIPEHLIGKRPGMWSVYQTDSVQWQGGERWVDGKLDAHQGKPRDGSRAYLPVGHPQMPPGATAWSLRSGV